MPRLLLSLLVMLAAFPAHAQVWETYRHDGGHGAGVCPIDDAQTGDYFCFLISCAPEGGPLWIRVAFRGEEMPDRSPRLVITVDGGAPETRTLTALDAEGAFDFGTSFEADRDAALLEALASGKSAEVVLGTGYAALRHTIPLDGSRRATDALPDLCGQ